MLQFNLRTLFIATTAAALLVWMFFAPPQWLGLFLIYTVYFLLPAADLAGIVYHRGYLRAFFIGMAPWIVIVAYAIAFQQYQWFLPDLATFNFGPDEVVWVKLSLAVPLVIAVLSGFVAMAIRWWAVATKRPFD